MPSYQNSAPIYYYHPDHLGSTSWVTDETGTEQQFLVYLPYGEPLMDVHLKTYDGRHGPDDIRYKFTGKERDAETGYDYMEQRYYYPPLSIWLRPDPLLDKCIHLSPYVYCSGNPLKYVDPDGNIIVFAAGTTSAQKKQFYTAVRYLNAHNCGGRYGQLKNSQFTYVIDMNTTESAYFLNDPDSNLRKIFWNPNLGLDTKNGGIILSPATILNHEFTHATHKDDDLKAREAYQNATTNAERKSALEVMNKYLKNTAKDDSNPYGSIEEESVITGIEQRTALLLGEIQPGQVTRTHHQGKPVIVENSTSTTIVQPAN